MRPFRFKRRFYRHFDLPITSKDICVKLCTPDYVARHSFLPLLHFEKKKIRYKKEERKTTRKIREIKISSHKDSCIYSYYAYNLGCKLEHYYEENNISENVIAYRALGKANYHFAADAKRFIKNYFNNNPNRNIIALCFDIEGFFDNLSHKIIKKNLKKIYKFDTIPEDWYKVYKSITKFSYVKAENIPKKIRRQGIICKITDLKKNNIPIEKNKQNKGIPQGTPISATISNLYMIDFDKKVSEECNKIGAFYRRYSDDILVLCDEGHYDYIKDIIEKEIKAIDLNIQEEKAEEVKLSKESSNTLQYLGFRFNHSNAYLREHTLSRQWRKLKRAIYISYKIKKSKKIERYYIKSLIRRFSYIKIKTEKNEFLEIRNFISYAERSHKAFGSCSKIKKQIKKFKKYALYNIKNLKGN